MIQPSEPPVSEGKSPIITRPKSHGSVCNFEQIIPSASANLAARTKEG
jgi:hypothetical protein